MIFQRTRRNLMLCQYLESEWSDPGNRFKKGKVTNTSQCGIVGNVLHWANKESFGEIKRGFL